MSSTNFSKTAGILAIISAILWLVIVVSWWTAGIMEPVGSIDRNASGAVFAIGYISFQIVGVLLPIIMTVLYQRHNGLGRGAIVGIGLIALAIPANVIPACFMCWGSLMLIGTTLFGTAMLVRQLAPRFPNLAFSSALAIGTIVWFGLRFGHGTLLEWGGIFGDWIPNLVGITVAAVIFAFGLFGLGVWLQKAV